MVEGGAGVASAIAERLLSSGVGMADAGLEVFTWNGDTLVLRG